jgi:UDP-glucuronate decarboxylase
MKKILITGGAGFIGSNLCERLLNDGNLVTCLDNFYSSDPSNIEGFLENPNFTFINHDIIVPLDIENDFDEIFHLACPASPKQYQRDPVFTLDTNYSGSKNILEFALLNNSKVLLSSTSEVYGDPIVHPQPETYWGNVNPIGIRSCYDEGKRISETLFMDYNRKFRLPIKIIRIFNTYGPKMQIDDGRVVTNFMSQIISKKPVTIYGDGKQTRSFCYITDMIDGIIRIMATSDDVTGPVNIGKSTEVTINELVNTLSNFCEETISIINTDLPSDDPRLRQPDLELLKKIIHWSPQISLIDGLFETYQYIKSKMLGE